MRYSPLAIKKNTCQFYNLQSYIPRKIKKFFYQLLHKILTKFHAFRLQFSDRSKQRFLSLLRKFPVTIKSNFQTFNSSPVAVRKVHNDQWSSSSPPAPWWPGNTSSSSPGLSCSCPDVLVSATKGIKMKAYYYRRHHCEACYFCL